MLHVSPPSAIEQIAGSDVEVLAALVHQAYLDTCERLCWTVSPSNQVPYAALSEDSKELDRATVRAVLIALGPPNEVPIEIYIRLESRREVAIGEKAGRPVGRERRPIVSFDMPASVHLERE